eukprot:CAMPEP_0116069426 /NCGR_PEP_ID=MMETSP0322-20121206/12294_1 /TAXON_ID=163516 /ORGANISM="Leptocylindrus danicus var. apora, Strain B651" /LENGTH=342 /DNA_ID=CAMNT_0003556815 /DNA_START=159 /DNA_END=1187 /DNA_ORIENTATION=+
MRVSNIVIAGLFSNWRQTLAFAPTRSFSSCFAISHYEHMRMEDGLVLDMAAGKKKKRRRRKEPATTTSSPLDESAAVVPVNEVEQEESDGAVAAASDGDGPSFKFNAADAAALGITDAEDEDDIPPTFAEAMAPSKSNEPLPKFSELGVSSKLGAIELPDIRDARKSKKADEDGDEEDEGFLPKVKRSDIEGVKKLLEVEPNADGDSQYFEKEEYGTISALLGEGAKSFLGIPPGPLQIGHFIGFLGISLCAFVSYPGFPLTNFPTPIRDALQGGLGTIILVNAVLAGFSVFKANERGQPVALWAIKTLGVGGLAFDQLTQLPTLEQIEEMKSRKGKRAIRR